MSGRVTRIALGLLVGVVASSASSAVFDDGNDRAFVKALRDKPASQRTEEEDAVLVGANKVGTIVLCGREVSGNAFVIRHRSCPVKGAAVVTSAHLFLDKSGRLQCSLDKALDAHYRPNTSYFSKSSDRADHWINRRVRLSFPPANWSKIQGANLAGRSVDDIAVFCLAEDITQDRMPDGSKRGHFRFGTRTDIDGNIYMLGRAPDFGNFTLMTYQKSCNGHIRHSYLYHACDTVDQSSGSLLGVMERGEIRFRSVHNNGLIGTVVLSAADKKEEAALNGGTASDNIHAERYESASDHAYDLQWTLKQAGCYSGKLDGDWGAGSRRALAAFANASNATLPGSEPAPELVAAVDSAALEGAKICR